MKKWMDASTTLIQTVVDHLPSPLQAQQYRTQFIYEGDANDQFAEAMKKCDPNGPLMMYVSKMIPTSDKGRFYAFGRVFSGTIHPGEQVKIMGPNYVQGTKKDVFWKSIQKAVVMMGRKGEQVQSVPCGNCIALGGIDEYLTKTGTISNHEEAANIRTMKYSVAPIVKVSVKPKNPQDLVKLLNGMKKLSKADPIVECINDEVTGENIIAGSGELHLEICINDLIQEYAQVEIIKDNPIVTYRETVKKFSPLSLSKSNNKLNRLFSTCEPI